jgi:hypothetical protein
MTNMALGALRNRLPTPTDWDLSRMPTARKEMLETPLSVEELAARLSAGAEPNAPIIEDATDRAAPSRTVRACFKIRVPADISDVLYNGITGLRARYWASPEGGDKFTATMILLLLPQLVEAIPAKPSLRSRRGISMTRERFAQALELPSAKVWVDEGELRKDGAGLYVDRWRENEGEPDNPRLWMFTPRAALIDVKTGWLTSELAEWIPKAKQNRALQIHRWGFT